MRGGTYFSLPPQRKVGKRKRLTPPAHVLIHGPPTSPHFTRQHFCSRGLPTLSPYASPASRSRVATRVTKFPTFYSGKRCVGHRAAYALLRTESARIPPCRSAALSKARPTHSLPLRGRGYSISWVMTSVRETGETLDKYVGNVRWLFRCRVKRRDVGGPWVITRISGVSRFLLPTFLCGGKEK